MALKSLQEDESFDVDFKPEKQLTMTFSFFISDWKLMMIGYMQEYNLLVYKFI